MSYDDFRKTRYFGSLDGLRCLSILAVLWHHTGYRHYPAFSLGSQGFLGVDLFFAISGFLITTLLLREREDYGGISIRDFYIRRTLRIFPLYFTVIGLYVVAVLLYERDTAVGREFMSNLPFFLTYTSNWFVQLDGRVIFYFAWSLATEEQFYLVWPVVERFLSGMGAVVTIFLLILLYAFATALPQDALWIVILSSIHPAILGGVLLAHALQNRRVFAVLQVALGKRWSAPAALACLLFALTVHADRWIIWTGMVLLVGTVVTQERNGLSSLLSWRPVAYIGTVSYGMYLLHMLVFNVAKKTTTVPMLWFPLTVVGTVIFAGISFRYYESWFLSLKSRFTRRRSETGADVERRPPPVLRTG